MSVSEISITVNDLTDVEYSFAESYSVNQDTSVISQKLAHESVVCRMEDYESNEIQHGDLNLTLSPDTGHLSKQSDEKTAVRQYFNKAGEFIVGIDPFSEEAKAKAEERIRRFGQVVRPEDIITDDVLSRLYASLGIDGPKDSNGNGDNHVRYGVIHVSGTDDLSTQDIFDYFREFVPTSIEWINDHSCNVIWSEAASAARAMLKLSQENEEQMKEDEGRSCSNTHEDCNNTADNGQEKMEVDKKVDDDDDDDDEDDDEDEDKKVSHGRRYKGFKEKNTNNPTNVDFKIGVEEDNKNNIIHCSDVKWRIGKPHPKSKMDLLMRFATSDDKKEPRANSKSIYYMKHGNPNYGGFKGLITRGCKQRIMRQQHTHTQPVIRQREQGPNEWKKGSILNGLQSDRRVREVEHKKKVKIAFKRKRWSDNEDGEIQDNQVEREHIKDRISQDVPRSKLPRMRMYADDEFEDETEEDKRRQASIWLRLGSNERGSRREKDCARVIHSRR